MGKVTHPVTTRCVDWNHNLATPDRAINANLPPLPFSGNTLTRMEKELAKMLNRTQTAAEQYGANAASHDHFIGSYSGEFDRCSALHQLNAMLTRLRKNHFSVHITGLDEVHINHDNMMLEACNTSFQIHIQIDPEEFVGLYNLTQLITAPVLAAP